MPVDPSLPMDSFDQSAVYPDNNGDDVIAAESCNEIIWVPHQFSHVRVSHSPTRWSAGPAPGAVNTLARLLGRGAEQLVAADGVTTLR